MAEARGGREDMALKEAYQLIYKNGATYPSLLTRDLAQRTLTSKHIKLKPKALNVAGLQLADVFAHPVNPDVHHADRPMSRRRPNGARRLGQPELPLAAPKARAQGVKPEQAAKAAIARRPKPGAPPGYVRLVRLSCGPT